MLPSFMSFFYRYSHLYLHWRTVECCTLNVLPARKMGKSAAASQTWPSWAAAEMHCLILSFIWLPGNHCLHVLHSRLHLMHSYDAISETGHIIPTFNFIDVSSNPMVNSFNSWPQSYSSCLPSFSPSIDWWRSLTFSSLHFLWRLSFVLVNFLSWICQ